MLKSVLPISFVEIEPDNFHLFIRVRIGRKNARLLLDTGASKTAFDEKNVLKFVDEKKLQAHEIQSVGLGSNQVQTQLCEIPYLRLIETILINK